MTIEITNVGAISNLEIPIPVGGGVVVLKGGNGTGKSTALNAVGRLTGGDQRLVPSDQHDTGLVEGAGVRLTVGRSTRAKGVLSVRTLDGIDPSQLVDPGVQDPDAADAKRFRVLFKLLGFTSDGSEFQAAARKAGIVLDAIDFSDPVAAAGRLRRAAQDEARKLEEDRVRCTSEAQGLEAAIEGIEPLAPDDAVDFVSEARSLAAELAESQAAATQHRQLDFRVRQLSVRVEELRGQLEAATADLEHAKSDLTDFGDPPNPQALQERLDGIELRQARQGQRIKAHESLERASALYNSADECDAKAVQCREAAQEFEPALMAKLGRGLPQGLFIENGRLMVNTDRPDPVRFASLSMGERYAFALYVAAVGADPGTLFTIRQEAWEGLDPDARAAVGAQARERGIVIVTAACDGGDLRAEVHPS